MSEEYVNSCETYISQHTTSTVQLVRQHQQRTTYCDLNSLVAARGPIFPLDLLPPWR